MKPNPFQALPLPDAVRRGIWTLTALTVPGLAFGAPTGGQVVAGSAAIAQAGAKTTITQSTAKGAINWQSFSIGTNEYVQFVQPGSASVTLNRVVGNDPSQLLGQMSANGQIFLVNPSGVYFGANARIDVAGLVATTFDIADDDFMAGRYQFARVDGRDPAQVINDGTITANGGYVVLAGDGVANHGLIEAYLGDIVMAAGERVGLDLGGDGLISFAIDGDALTEIAGVENTGELYADGGRVFLTAKVQGDLLPTAVNHEGLIQARTVEERDGVVYLGGSGGDVMIAGTIDADADTVNNDGGRILVASNNDITVSDGALITARGDGSGDGGIVRLIASETLDIESLTTVTTEGGASGQGGFIEVSGHVGLNVRGAVTPGPGGELLIDPNQIVIRGGAGSTTYSFTSSPSSFSQTSIYEETIEGYLDAGTDVTLVATNLITVDGGIFDNNAIDAKAGVGDLTLAIGTLSASSASPVPAGALEDLGLVGCGTGGVCTPNPASFDPPFYLLNQASNATIRLNDGAGSWVNIDINGSVAIKAGPSFGSVQVQEVLSGTGITIDGNVRYAGSGQLKLGSGSLSPFGADITVNGNVFSSGAANAVTGGILIDGRNITVSDYLAHQVAASTGTASVRLVATSDINIGGATARNFGGGGNALVDISAGGNVTLGGYDVAAIANQGSAQVSITAGVSLLWNDNNILALDYLPSCSYGGCFQMGTASTSTGTVTGLLLPDITPGNGNVGIHIEGAELKLLSDFEILGSPSQFRFLNVEGLIGAIGGDVIASQTSPVEVVNTDIWSVQFGGNNTGPLIYSKNDTLAGVKIDAVGSINITGPKTGILEGSTLVPYTILAENDTSGSALIELAGLSANVNAASVVARGQDTGRVLMTGGSVSVAGNPTNSGSIFASGVTGSGVVDLLSSGAGIFVNSAGRVVARSLSSDASVNLIESGSSGSQSILVAGDVRAEAPGSASVKIEKQASGSGELRVNGGATLFAGNVSSTGSDIRAATGMVSVRTWGGTLDLGGQITGLGSSQGRINVVHRGSGDLLVNGTLRAEGDANGWLLMNQMSSGAIVVAPSANLMAKADTGWARLLIDGQGTTQINNIVPILASGGTDADITISGQDGVMVTGDLTASATSAASDYDEMVLIRANTASGSVDVTGRVTAGFFFVQSERDISASSVDANRTQLSAKSGQCC